MFNLDKYDVIFWDFDGVIKESVSVKTDAYVELFKPYGSDVCKQVKNHHLANGGMSRYDKIPLYLKWAGLEQSGAEVQNFCGKFGGIVKDKVIASAWVPGVEEFLRNNKKNHIFVLVSATPQSELEDICKSLELTGVFCKIYGAPNSKKESIRTSIIDYKVHTSTCLMIGDAEADFEAAQDNEIHFIFRKHQDNLSLPVKSNTQTINDFCF
ncbi:HAD hydrolase-like protein [Pseudomonadales bacterium]|nr:HAD hydrolase-like protein [Pseudomonadales bacterium]